MPSCTIEKFDAEEKNKLKGHGPRLRAEEEPQAYLQGIRSIFDGFKNAQLHFGGRHKPSQLLAALNEEKNRDLCRLKLGTLA